MRCNCNRSNNNDAPRIRSGNQVKFILHLTNNGEKTTEEIHSKLRFYLIDPYSREKEIFSTWEDNVIKLSINETETGSYDLLIKYIEDGEVKNTFDKRNIFSIVDSTNKEVLTDEETILKIRTDFYLNGDMRLSLKGDKGDPFRYEDFTPEQLQGLRGERGLDHTEDISRIDQSISNLVQRFDSLESTPKNKEEIITPKKLAEEYLRLVDNEYQESDKPRTYREFINRFPRGTVTKCFNQVIEDCILKQYVTKVRQDVITPYKLIKYFVEKFNNGVLGSDAFRENFLPLDYTFNELFLGITAVANNEMYNTNIVISTIQHLMGIWYIGEPYPDLADTETVTPEGVSEYIYKDGKTLYNTDMGSNWEYIENGLNLFKVLTTLYLIEEPILASMMFNDIYAPL